jgi:hypothetical protein
MAFPRPIGLEAWMIDEGAALGFNDVCLHTEYSRQRAQIIQAREHLVRTGALGKIKAHGMTLSLWTREWVDFDESWGALTVDNPVVWEKVSQRYDEILDVLFPEIDYLVFITAETKISLKGEAYFRMIDLVHSKLKARGKKLILRNFSHSPEELNQWPARAARLPDDIIIQTKCVPVDWSLRARPHPLIGRSPGHQELVEFDAGGEYFRRDHMAVAAADLFAPQYDYAAAHGMAGISIRVERYEHHVFRHPNFINVYFLLGRAMGRFATVDEAWASFCTEYYGRDLARQMEEILRPTGEAVAEAIYIRDEIFGNSARDFLGGWTGKPRISTPYAWSYSPRAWGRKLFPDYDDTHLKEIDLGHPRIVKLEQEAYARQLAALDQSLARLEALKPRLEANTYALHRWLVEESRFHLILMEEATLAWLHVKRAAAGKPEDRPAALAICANHLARIRALEPETTRTLDVEWKGRRHKYRRGEYYDLPRLQSDFASWIAGAFSEKPLKSP